MTDTNIDYSNEVWKPVVEFEDKYEVSNMGRVRSLNRLILRTNGVTFRKKGKMVSPWINHKGYACIKCLRPNSTDRSRRKHFLVHRWVMAAFFGPSTLDVDHINSIKTDNRLENLRYLTDRANTIAAFGRSDDMLYITYLPGRADRNDRPRWAVSLYHNGKRVQVGSRNNLEKARAIRDEYIRKHNINCFGIMRNNG